MCGQGRAAYVGVKRCRYVCMKWACVRAGVVVWLVLVSGCMSTPHEVDLRDVPAYVPENVYATSALPTQVRRVVLLPVVASGAGDSFAAQFQQLLGQELMRSAVAEVVVVSEQELRAVVGVPRVDAGEPLPSGFFEAVKAHFGAEAVLFAELSSYHPYRPMRLGVRARLVQVREQTTLWACDELFDTGDARVMAGARRWEERYRQRDLVPQPSDAVLQSPRRFASYAAWELVRTLPPR